MNRVNGDRKFLAQLRDAYRSYVKDLATSNQPALAEVYQARLKILEDNEASYTALATSTSGPAAPAVSQTPVATQAPVVSQPPVATQAPAKIEGTSPAPAAPQPVPAAQSTVRPKADPFDAANELKLAVSGFQEKVSPAKDFLARANLEFVQEHYAAAKQLYEQANQADARALDEDNRKRWAYCQLAIAVDLLNSPPGQSCDWNRLDADVRNALAVAPQLARPARRSLAELPRRRGPAATFRPSPFVPVKHTGRGEHGWQVAETVFSAFSTTRPTPPKASRKRRKPRGRRCPASGWEPTTTNGGPSVTFTCMPRALRVQPSKRPADHDDWAFATGARSVDGPGGGTADFPALRLSHDARRRVAARDHARGAGRPVRQPFRAALGG